MVTGRFAPSPTGRMHLGNAFAALISWLSARSRGGEWILRIEDLDRGRCREEYVETLKKDLLRLGLDWDRGGDGEYRQSNRGHIYEDQLSKLAEFCYPCWCTRAELLDNGAPHESDGRVIYSGLCRNNPERSETMAGKPAATRLIVTDEEICFIDRHYGPQRINPAKECGDYVLKRSDGSWAYQFAVVVDDALMGVTEVVRGRDLLLSAAQQIQLARTLGFKEPEYAHFPLLCSQDGRRLSKRDRSLDLGALFAEYRPEEIIGKLARMAGIIDNEEPCRPAELLEFFDWNSIPTDDIIATASRKFVSER